MTFTAKSRGVAARFLQSAVVFDDEASFGPTESHSASADSPSKTPVEEEAPTGAGPLALVAPTPEEDSDIEVAVDAKALGDAFAREGLICAFLKPNVGEKEQEGSLLVRAARRADIVVLDWSIHGDLGATTRDLIRQILEADEEEEEKRLRLVVIYTSRLESETILDRIVEEIDAFFVGEETIRDEFGVSKGPLTVVLYGKPAGQILGASAATRAVPEDELPKLLIDDFAKATAGLVPMVALAGLAAIRAETHRILTVLSADMDPAYIAQRILLSDPDEASEQLVGLIASELRSVMEDRKVGDEADANTIEDWLRWKMSTDSPLGIIDGNDREEDDLAMLLRDGLNVPAADESAEIKDIRTRRGAPLNRKKRHRVAELFARDEEEASHANDMLAMKLSLRSHYRNPPRTLQLGTLVRDPDGHYLLCVQPVCDSFHLGDGRREFPFLPALVDEEHFDIVARDPEGNARKTLRFVHKPYAIRKIEFTASPGTGCVQAEKVEDLFRFIDAMSKPYVWIARLEDGYAQRVAHGLGTELSRVGLAEAEWLRARAKAD